MTDKCISPLRRMIEDMTVRNFVPKTQSDYTAVRHVQVAEMRARQASMPIRQRGRLARRRSSCSRELFNCRTIEPR
jgi:hypothetical protein